MDEDPFRVRNGKFYYGTSVSDDKVAFVALTALTGEEEGALVRAYARERSALADIEEFVRGQFLKAGVRGY